MTTDITGRVELKNLRAWREAKRMTQEELERASGVARKTITRLENRNNFAYAATVKRLACGLGITPQALAYDEPR